MILVFPFIAPYEYDSTQGKSVSSPSPKSWDDTYQSSNSHDVRVLREGEESYHNFDEAQQALEKTKDRADDDYYYVSVSMVRLAMPVPTEMNSYKQKKS